MFALAEPDVDGKCTCSSASPVQEEISGSMIIMVHYGLDSVASEVDLRGAHYGFHAFFKHTRGTPPPSQGRNGALRLMI